MTNLLQARSVFPPAALAASPLQNGRCGRCGRWITPIVNESFLKRVFRIVIVPSTTVSEMTMPGHLQISIVQKFQLLGPHTKPLIPCQRQSLAVWLGSRFAPITLGGVASAPHVNDDAITLNLDLNSGDASGLEILICPLAVKTSSRCVLAENCQVGGQNQAHHASNCF